MIDKIGGGDCLLERDKMREAGPYSEVSRCSLICQLMSKLITRDGNLEGVVHQTLTIQVRCVSLCFWLVSLQFPCLERFRKGALTGIALFHRQDSAAIVIIVYRDVEPRAILE